VPILNVLGRHELFEGTNVGYGSLVTIGLIQWLYFGLAGYEMALLVLEKYGVSNNMYNQFIALASQMLPHFYSHFYQIIATSISERRWNDNYVPAQDMHTLLETHQVFLNKMGIVSDIYNLIYWKYLQATVVTEGRDVGISAVIKQYSTDGFTFDDGTIRSDESNEL
jgi:hypothetical protein